MVAAARDGMLDFASFGKVHEDIVAVLAHHGDTEAVQVLWEQALSQCARITHRFAAKYPWIDHDDLIQQVIIDFPKYVRRYKPEKAHSWNKFLYFAFYRATQDALRKYDPLGISVPQKKPYPAFRRLSDLADDPFRLEGIVMHGVHNLDANYPANMSSIPAWDSPDVHEDHKKRTRKRERR